jgi:SAM-dependent methyltransferase
MTYQSFAAGGDSDSPGKLARLHLPADLTGLSVLDVACNEGFFCQEAWRRGAARVVGLDKNPDFVERAKQRDSKTEYLEMDYLQLPSLAERFDVILLLSAMHYALDPQKLLIDILDLLAPNGLFVLECGVAPGRRPEWVTVERPVGDVVRHPTHAMLIKALRRASVRRIGTSVNQVGDPIDRYVYHARPLKPIVMLVAGPSGSGKSTLLTAMSHGGYLIPMNLDHLLVTMPTWCEDEELLQELQDSSPFESDQLHKLVDHMVSAGVEEAFVKQTITHHRVMDPEGEPALTVIEGYALSQGNFRAAFTRQLQQLGCYVWNVEPAASADGRNSAIDQQETEAVSDATAS